jgi:protein SDA1
LQKYIRPHQRYVTQIIAYTIQATHNLVLPEVLEPIVRTLCNEFVSDRSGPEAMAVGLNSVREICKRQPLVMDEALLNDLVQYKKHRDKSVIMAARSLIGLFREVNPELLNKRDRGKDASENVQRGQVSIKEYGQEDDMMVIEPEDLAAQSILGDDELHQLSTWKLRKKMKLDRKGESDEEMSDIEEESKIVDPSSLEAYKKLKKRERDDMLEKIKEKREKPYGARKPGGGTTNEEKLRLKPFQFAKYSRRVQSKIMNSLGQKNSNKAKHAHTMKVRDKKRRRCRRT